MHITQSSYHHDHPDQCQKTILSTMYNICLVCIMETLKILGEKLLQSQPESSEVTNPKRKLQKAPSRTQSKVIRVNQNWVDQILIQKQRSGESSVSSPNSGRRSRSMPAATRRSRCFSGLRRNSYPPIQRQSKLECVIEEDLSSLIL